MNKELIIDQDHCSNPPQEVIDEMGAMIRVYKEGRSESQVIREDLLELHSKIIISLEGFSANPNQLSLAYWLQKYLHAAEITQTELAQALGLSRSYINNILAGRQRIGESFAIRMEIHSGIPAKYWYSLQQRIDLATRLNNPELRKELEQKVKPHSARL